MTLVTTARRDAFATLVLAIVSAAALGACATAPTADEAIAAGGTALPSGAELIGDDGYTMLDVNGNWATFLGPDGRKVVAVEGAGAEELTWRLAEDGTFCEQYYSRGGEERCGASVVRVRDADGVHVEWVDGEWSDLRYTIERGNPRGL